MAQRRKYTEIAIKSHDFVMTSINMMIDVLEIKIFSDVLFLRSKQLKFLPSQSYC